MRYKLLKTMAIFIAPAIAIGADTPNSGDSSVLLSIYNDGAASYSNFTTESDQTLTIDTGLKFSDLLRPSSGTITVDVDALVGANLSGYSSVADVYDDFANIPNLQMQVTAFDGQLTGGAVAGDRAMFTSYTGSAPSGTNVQLNSSVTNADAYYGFASSSGVDYTTSATGGAPSAQSSGWGDNFGGAWSTIDNSGDFQATGDTKTIANMSELTLNMAYVATGGSGSNGAPLQVISGSYTVAFDFATGDLVFTTAAVPVPAAVWLFGSAIAGLIGFSRRSSIAVSA